jgi:hypothetical protein
MDDVNVLRQACCAFRNLFLKLVKMDPFRDAITISSICNKVFWTMFLKPDTKYYPESRLPYGGLKVFNGWRIWDGHAKLFMPVMGGKCICQGYLM